MKRAHGNMMRDDKKWQDRMQNQRKDMRSKLDEATKHFAREIHSDQVAHEREKLHRNRKMGRHIREHQEQWRDFEQAEHSQICISNIPFPPDKHNPLCLPQNATAAERKATYRKSSLRWHPHKFFARYGQFVQPEELAAVEAKVKETFQLVNEAWHGS